MLPDNTLRLALAPDSDPACAELSALALLLMPRNASDAAPTRAGGRPPGLFVKTEVRHTAPSLHFDEQEGLAFNRSSQKGGRPPGLSVKIEVRHTAPSHTLMSRKLSFQSLLPKWAWAGGCRSCCTLSTGAPSTLLVCLLAWHSCKCHWIALLKPMHAPLVLQNIALGTSMQLSNVRFARVHPTGHCMLIDS